MDQYLTFLLGEQEYAIDILKVQGIQGWNSCTELPNTPAHVLGVINLRGAIVPIIDLRIRFALPSVVYNDITVIIVVSVVCNGQEKTVGLVVDAVSEVYNINSSSLSVPPDFGAEVDIAYVQGLATVNDDLVIALNVDKLIAENLLGRIYSDISAA